MGRIVLPEGEYFPVYSNGIHLKPTEKTLIKDSSDGYGVFGNVYEYGDSDEIVFDFSDDDEPYTTYFICDGRMVSIFVEFDPAKTYYSALFYFKKGDASGDICVFSQDVLTHLDDYIEMGISSNVLVVDIDNIPPYFENAVYGVAFDTNGWVNGKQWFELNTVVELGDGYPLKDVTEFVKNGEAIRISNSYNGDKPLYIAYDSSDFELTGNGMTFKSLEGSNTNMCAIYRQGKNFTICDAGNVESDGNFIVVNGVKAGIINTAEYVNYSIDGQSFINITLGSVT